MCQFPSGDIFMSNRWHFCCRFFLPSATTWRKCLTPYQHLSRLLLLLLTLQWRLCLSCLFSAFYILKVSCALLPYLVIIFPNFMEGKRHYFILVTFPLQSDTSNLSCNGIYFILLPTFCLYVSRVSLFVCCQICQSLIKTDCEQIESQFAGWLLGSSST